MNIEDEIIRRLEILEDKGLWDAVRKSYRGTNQICMSEPISIAGTVIGLINPLNAECDKVRKEFEEEYNRKVYFGILSNTSIGRMLSLFYIGEEEEWEMDRNDLKNGYPLVYVHNFDGDFGEFGSIGYEVSGGGLIRTA